MAAEQVVPVAPLRAVKGRPILGEAYRDYVLVAEAAYHLGVHQNTVRNRIKSGELPAQKIKTERGETYVIPRSVLGLAEGARPKWYAAWWASYWPKDWRGRLGWFGVMGLSLMLGMVLGVLLLLVRGHSEDEQSV
jgi:excisionase family DNA binding protein